MDESWPGLLVAMCLRIWVGVCCRLHVFWGEEADVHLTRRAPIVDARCEPYCPETRMSEWESREVEGQYKAIQSTPGICLRGTRTSGRAVGLRPWSGLASMMRRRLSRVGGGMGVAQGRCFSSRGSIQGLLRACSLLRTMTDLSEYIKWPKVPR